LFNKRKKENIMPSIKLILNLSLLVLVFTVKTFSQEFLDEKNMKITETSTDPTYAYTENNPAKIGDQPQSNGKYLNALKCQDGDKMHIKDMKLDYHGTKGLYYIVLKYDNKPDTTILFLLSSKYETVKAPKGFLFKTIDDLPKVIAFPADSIKKVKSCYEKIYIAPNLFLVKKFGTNMPQPNKAPEYEGGIDSLKKYFKMHPLTDENAKKISFDIVIYIFVNCSGDCGNYYLLSKPYGDVATYANQVLAIVNNMPQKWLPALEKGKPIDCYQVLTFNVKNGSLEEVSY
jgi:hypothetical protein